MTAPTPRVFVVIGGIPLYGAELATIDVGCMLRDAGAEVVFLTHEDWGHVAVNPRLEALGFAHEGMPVFGRVDRGIGPRRMLALAISMARANGRLWRLLRRHRPTHVHLATHWDAFHLWPALRLSGVRLVFQLHNVPVLRHPLLRAFWHVLFRGVDVVVVVSRQLAARCVDSGLSARRLEVIPNRPPRRVATASRVPLARLAGTMFVCVGQVAPFKGTDHVVEALARLVEEGRDVGCWIVGGCHTPWATALRDRVASGPLAARIVFAGYIEDPSDWFAAADAHLAPSMADEAFGIVVAEAKQAGRPSIVYADGALPELVQDGVDGRVVARGDVPALAQAMRDYADDADLARRHGGEARRSLGRLGIEDAPAAWARLYGVPS